MYMNYIYTYGLCMYIYIYIYTYIYTDMYECMNYIRVYIALLAITGNPRSKWSGLCPWEIL